MITLGTIRYNVPKKSIPEDAKCFEDSGHEPLYVRNVNDVKRCSESETE